jgi:hypothetical protein
MSCQHDSWKFCGYLSGTSVTVSTSEVEETTETIVSRRTLGWYKHKHNTFRATVKSQAQTNANFCCIRFRCTACNEEQSLPYELCTTLLELDGASLRRELASVPPQLSTDADDCERLIALARGCQSMAGSSCQNGHTFVEEKGSFVMMSFRFCRTTQTVSVSVGRKSRHQTQNLTSAEFCTTVKCGVRKCTCCKRYTSSLCSEVLRTIFNHPKVKECLGSRLTDALSVLDSVSVPALTFSNEQVNKQ